ncbi:restriction endonuclease subunit S [Escherichia coli]|uniref:restriction endonuclease subunit S n=1 Tax=Enterobacteriaceae TaxID=543 RepID=UPI000C4EE9FE|nr:MULTISPECIES: restriction endonuclease subunit S [Enterobacteriaceae]EFA4818326.1 restriction endonuclease subunit S [Escherichia coli]EFM2102414.1 restriction endonuclease subunit S [Escherichia coli]EGQ5284929.1 restriction endonuclease subunit S [Enterobacter hormaechei]EHL5671304.1 restriction endonuclease subunit S [Escherichia coli]EHN8852723.1 restriction endonuclease subunit S [Enterobacter hormaechei]
MVPKGWKRVPIKDVCESIIDCVNKTAPVVDYETPFKMIRTTNVRNGRVNTEDVRYVTEDTYLQWVRRGKPQVGDIIFTREAPVGEAGVLQDAEGIFLGQRTMMYRADTCLSDNYFLFYSLSSPFCQKQIEDFSNGGTVAHMRVPDCGEILINLPPFLEQKKIAQILSTWDKAISVTEKLLTNSQQQKKALMQQLLTGKKRLLDENGVRFSGEWEVVRLKQLIHEEKKRNRDNHIQRVLSVTNHSGFVLPEEQFSKRVASEDVSTYKIVKKNQYGYNPSRLNVGSFARLDNYDEGVLSPMYVVFSINHERLNSDYFLNWMSSNEAKQRIAGSTQGSVRDSVGFDALCSFSFSLPTLMEQQKIAAVLSAADAEMSMLEKKLACLKEEKKALMQQLLTGKRRVKVESEETVSA